MFCCGCFSVFLWENSSILFVLMLFTSGYGTKPSTICIHGMLLILCCLILRHTTAIKIKEEQSSTNSSRMNTAADAMRSKAWLQKVRRNVLESLQEKLAVSSLWSSSSSYLTHSSSPLLQPLLRILRLLISPHHTGPSTTAIHIEVDRQVKG